MVLDKKGKLFGKVSVVDIFVIILIAGLLAGAFYKLSSPVTNAIFGGDSTIYFSVRIQDVREFTQVYYKPGMSVYDSKTGLFLGRIEEVHVEPFVAKIEKSDGTIVAAAKPERIEIVLDIAGQGIETSQAFLVEGSYEVKIGAGVLLGTKYVDVSGYICAVSAKKN